MPASPVPIPTTVTFLRGFSPNRSQSSARHCETVMPLSSDGRRITTGVTPSAFAARSFSPYPPTSPVSLVTRYAASVLFSIARFSSSENGPCMQIRFFPENPSANAASADSLTGRMRANRRVSYPVTAVYAESSLLPTVRSTLPCVPFKNATASAVSETNTHPSSSAQDARATRMQSVCVCFAASAMLFVASTAYGCVASITSCACVLRISAAISSVFLRPCRTRMFSAGSISASPYSVATLTVHPTG